MVQQLGLRAFPAQTWVQSLVGELRSWKSCGLAKRQTKRQNLDNRIVFAPLYSQSWLQCLANSRSSINSNWVGGFLGFFSLTSCTLSSSKRASDSFVPPASPLPLTLHTHIFPSSSATGDRSSWHIGEVFAEGGSEAPAEDGSRFCWCMSCREEPHVEQEWCHPPITDFFTHQPAKPLTWWGAQEWFRDSALRDNKCRFQMTQNLSSGLLLCSPFH